MFTVYKEEKLKDEKSYEVTCPKCGLILSTKNPEAFRWGGLDIVTDCTCGAHFKTPIPKVRIVKARRCYVQVDPGKQ